jgi:hypothetical protein
MCRVMQTYCRLRMRVVSRSQKFASLLFLYERVGNLFASVDGRDDDEEGAARDDEAELAVSDVAFVVCSTIS